MILGRESPLEETGMAAHSCSCLEKPHEGWWAIVRVTQGLGQDYLACTSTLGTAAGLWNGRSLK